MKKQILVLIMSIICIMHYAQCVPSPTNPDSDGDGIADICDLDDDNDGILDCVENGANPFTDVFVLNNDAIYATPLSGGPAYQVRLVPDIQSKRGQAWSKNKVNFMKDFVIPMKIYISSGPVDADGMAIVFQNQGTNASGITGQGLGARGIPNGIALEIDIFQNTCLNDSQNSGNCDPTFDHGSIRTTSGWVGTGKLAGDTQLGNGDIADNAWHTVIVTWNAATRNLSYTFDGVPVTNYTFAASGANSIETILGGTSAYFGYTASTGLNNSEHRIGFDFPCDLPLFRDTDGDGIPDYLDLDSDNDGCPDAIEGGASFTSANLVSSSMSGGNVGATSGSFNQPINQNLGNVVNTTSTSVSYGVPTVAGSGQTIGTSQTANPVLVAGTAGANQTIASGSTPIALSLTGATGSIQWQVSTDNVTFTSISGATNSTYATGPLTSTRYYRAIVTSTGGCTAISNIVIINVNIPCAVSANNPDSDGDGIADDCDLDDDNDGILDCEENLLNRPVNEIFKINGNAQTVSSTEVRLTQNAQFQSGQLWSNGKTDFTKSFTISFQAYLGDNNDGADGIAIVFHNDPAGVNANGEVGSGLGARGIQNGIVLELDTFENWWESISDIAADHGHIWQSSNQASLSTPVALSNLENGAWHTVTVTWDRSTNTLSYAVNGTLAGFYTGDIINSIFAGANKVYFGFTGSTGGFSNEQKVRFSQTCSLPFELDTDGDGIPNHLDSDSDNDGCSDAVEGGAAFTSANLVNSSMPGGNSGATSGSFNQPVTQNLGNTVNTTSTSTSYGVPTVAGSGQTIGTSQTANAVLVAGTAGANQTITSGSTPTALMLTGATGSIQWQVSTNNTLFTNISGATNATYAPGILTATRYYRAIVTSVGGCTAISNTVTVNVVPPYDCTGKIYSLSSVTGEIRVFNTPDSSGVLGTVMNTTPHPTALSPAPNGPNALGYSNATGKFYYVLNQNNGAGNTFVSYDPITNIYQTLAGTTGYIYRGTVTNDGLGYYGLTSSNELKYYDITNNTWTSITDYYVDQNGNDLFAILSTYSGGDIAIDGNGDLWILAGTNSSPTTFLFRAKGPLPKTDMGATPIVLEQIVQQNIGSGSNGIAFNSSGELFITNSANLFKLNTNFTISTVGSVSPSNGGGDLASCAFPLNPYSISDFGDAPDSYGTLLTSNGPRHTPLQYNATNNTSTLMIGSKIDLENDGFPNANSNGDDNDNINDENSVTMPVLNSTATSYSITVPVVNSTGASVTLRGWIDFNKNGTFEASEAAFVSVPNGSTTASLTWSGLSGLSAGDTYYRIRIAQNNSEITQPTGLAIGGEVEDGKISISGPVVCYRDPVNNGTGSETKMGITLLKRAGNNDPSNWPMVRKSGHIALESNTQGFVVTRIAKADLGNITNPQEGMMVYDTTDKCLKIYSDNAWKCFSTPACP